jgi:hypothetical protein
VSFLFCIIIFLLIVILFTKSFLLGLMNISFRPLSTKNFQAKIKQVEDMAAKLLLPRAHSGGSGEVGKQLPPWVEFFHRYFELKKNQLLKSANYEQVHLQLQTMQNTILPLPVPLGQKMQRQSYQQK